MPRTKVIGVGGEHTNDVDSLSRSPRRRVAKSDRSDQSAAVHGGLSNSKTTHPILSGMYKLHRRQVASVPHDPQRA